MNKLKKSNATKYSKTDRKRDKDKNISSETEKLIDDIFTNVPRINKDAKKKKTSLNRMSKRVAVVSQNIQHLQRLRET